MINFVFLLCHRLDLFHHFGSEALQCCRTTRPKKLIFGSLVGNSDSPNIPNYAIDFLSTQASNCFPLKLQADYPSASCQSKVFYLNTIAQLTSRLFRSLSWSTNILKLLSEFLFLTDILIQAHVSSSTEGWFLTQGFNRRINLCRRFHWEMGSFDHCVRLLMVRKFQIVQWVLVHLRDHFRFSTLQ